MSPEDKEVAKAFINQVWRKLKTLAGDDTDTEADNEIELIDPAEEEYAVRDQEDEDEFDFDHNLGDLARSQALSPPQPSQRENLQQQIDQLSLELEAYDKLPRLTAADQIMDFWKDTQKLEFPVLKEIALAIISAPVTEVSVERLFSHLTFILNRYRSTLKADLLADIMFLRLNKKFEH